MIEAENAVSAITSFVYECELNLQNVITITPNEHSLVVSDIHQSLNEGSYEMGNVSLTFDNKNNWASHEFAKEAPIKKRVSVYVYVNNVRKLLFNGIVTDAKVTPYSVELTLTT